MSALVRVWRSQWLAGTLLLLGTFLFGSISYMLFDLDAHLGPGQPTAEARVVEVEESARSTWVTLEFVTPEEGLVVAETDEFFLDPVPVVGDVAEVYYNPLDPSYYVRDVRLGDNTPVAVLMGAFAPLCLVGGVLGLIGRLPRFLLNR